MIFKIENLTKTFARGSEKFNAIEQVNLNIKRGEFINIIGRSGSGKSTLLNIMAGLLSPTAGQIYFQDTDLYNLTDQNLADLRNQSLGYIPQNFGALHNLTVFDNVRLPYYLMPRDGDPNGRATYLLEEVGLSELSSMLPGQLSGGELRRMLIARALMNNPEVLLADEPTANLDVETTKEIMKLLEKINHNGTTIIVVTHEIDTLEFGNRLLKMASGHILEE